jgi:uncharacterized protein
MFNARHISSDSAARQPDFRDKALIFIGWATHPVETRRWLRFLTTHPLLREVAPSPTAFLGKIHRPYLSARLRCGDRVDLLMKHYDRLFNHGFGSLLRQAMQKPLRLCRFSGKSGASYELQLSALDPGQQGGELSLRLVSAGVCIYTVACIVTASEGKTALMVGALTGMLTRGREGGIKQVTRDLYGCRPRELMITLARDLGRCLGCDKTLLIGNDNRIPPGEKHICKKSSDYDRTWRELHATRRPDGDYELPCNTSENTLGRAGCASSAPHAFMPTRRSVLVETVRVALRANITTRRSASRYIFTSPLAPAIREEVLERSHM